MKNRTPNNKATQKAPPRFFTISDVADFLDVSSRTIRRIDLGDLPIHRFGRAFASQNRTFWRSSPHTAIGSCRFNARHKLSLLVNILLKLGNTIMK